MSKKILYGALSVLLVAVMMLGIVSTYAFAATTATGTLDLNGTTTIIVMAKDVASYAKITDAMVTTKTVKNSVLPSNAITDKAEVVGKYAKLALYAGDYVYSDAVSTKNPTPSAPVTSDPKALRKDVGKCANDFVLVSEYIIANCGKDVADYIQKLIDMNPNATIYFPQGEYIIGKPIFTSSDPKKAVLLKLDQNAVLKAASNFTAVQGISPMVCIGGKEFSETGGNGLNDNHSVGSYYGIYGGILDCGGIADGLYTDFGRESSMRDVTIKSPKTRGVLVRDGANGISSDMDFEDITIIGTGAAGTIGLDIIGYDNTFSDFNIYDCAIGVNGANSGGNSYKDFYIVNTGKLQKYSGSVAFKTGAAPFIVGAYVENYETVVSITGTAYGTYSNIRARWTTDQGSQIMFNDSGAGAAHISGCRADFTGDKGGNYFYKGTAGSGNIVGAIYNTSLCNTVSSSLIKSGHKVTPLV